MLFEPCGELRRDYGAYCETLRLTEREDVFSSITTNVEMAKESERKKRLWLENHGLLPVEPAPEGDEAAAATAAEAEGPDSSGAEAGSASKGSDEVTPPNSSHSRGKVSPRLKKTRSDSKSKKGSPAKNSVSLPEPISVKYAVVPCPTLTFIIIRHPKFCMNQRDITPLCRAMPFCPSLVSVEFAGAGLSMESYLLLTEAVYRSRRVVTVKVDFNCLAKPGFVTDPTAPPTRPNSPSSSISALAVPAVPVMPATPVLSSRGSDGRKGSRREKRASSSAAAAAAAAAAASAAARCVDRERGYIFLRPTELCALHLIPTPLEEQINDEKEKKGKVDPKKMALLQAQQEAIERFNDAHQVRLPRSWGSMLLTAVSQLSLRGNGIDDGCISEMCRLILSNPNTPLVSLNLWGNVITDEGARAISKLLHSNRTIRVLDLGHNKIGDKGVLDIISAFQMLELNSDEVAAYRRRVLTRSGASEKERQTATQSLALGSLPSYRDIYHVWHAQHFPSMAEERATGKETTGAGKRGATSKSRTKEPSMLTLVRPVGPFDRDCIRVNPGENLFRVPGNTVLEVLNLAENTELTLEGIREARRILSLREPQTDEAISNLVRLPSSFGDAESSTVTGINSSPVTTQPTNADSPRAAGSIRGHTNAANVAGSPGTPTTITVYPPELHCAGLQLRCCTLFHYNFGLNESGRTAGAWKEMSAEQEKLNEVLDSWYLTEMDSQKPPPVEKGQHARKKNH